MRKLHGLSVIVSLFTLLLLPALLRAQNAKVVAPLKERYGIDRYLNIRSASSPALSPNGDRVAFLTNITGTPQVWMTGAQGGWPEQMTFYSDRVDFVRWSPDGTG